MSYQINFRVDIVGRRGGVPQCWTDPTILSFTSDKNQSVDEEGLKWKRSWQLRFSNFLCKQNKRVKESLLLSAAILRGEKRGLCHDWLLHFLDNRELKQRPFAATYVNRKWTFCILGQWFCLNFQAKKLNNTNLEASMHIIR